MRSEDLESGGFEVSNEFKRLEERLWLRSLVKWIYFYLMSSTSSFWTSGGLILIDWSLYLWSSLILRALVRRCSNLVRVEDVGCWGGSGCLGGSG